MSPHSRSCPECRRPMHPIRVVDKAHYGMHSDLEYTAIEAKKSFWTSGYPIEGAIEALMCDTCGRVQFYAKPKG